MKDWLIRKQFSVPNWALKYPKTYVAFCVLSFTAAWATVIAQWVKIYRDMTWEKRNRPDPSLVYKEDIETFSQGWTD